jgi:hypothetical protein
VRCACAGRSRSTWDELSGWLESSPVDGGARLDVETGEIWSAEVEGLDSGEGLGLGEAEPADFEDPDRWLWIDGVGSGVAYRDMVDFAATVTDSVLGDRLEVALDGAAPFAASRTFWIVKPMS